LVIDECSRKLRKKMNHVVIIGGGFAGLAAAVRLVDEGARVTLVERRPRLGGRAYSIVDETTGDAIDNGQHLLLGCYRETRALLDRIGASSHLRLQEKLRLAFVDGKSGKMSHLEAARRWPQPLDLLGALANWPALSWRDKLALIPVATAIRHPSRLQPPATDWETVDGWLDRLGQSASARRALFHPLAVAALNDDPRTASARLFAAVLREAFFGAGADARIAAAGVPLSQLYAEPAAAWLRARGAELRLGAPVARVLVDGDVARGVALRDGAELRADAVVAAVPPRALLQLVDEPARAGQVWWTGLDKLATSPIVSLHLWLDRLVTDEPIIGVLDSPLHWIFHRNQLAPVRAPDRSHLSLVVSAARALVDLPADTIVARLHGELARLLPSVARARVVHARVIKERDATIAHTAGTETLRPRVESPIAGLFVAGDWLRTGLPATIESAVRSAGEAATLALAFAAPRATTPATRGAFVPLSRLSRPQSSSPSSSSAGGAASSSTGKPAS
jgi:squalene-associated FAD-dependent desaturase